MKRTALAISAIALLCACTPAPSVSPVAPMGKAPSGASGTPTPRAGMGADVGAEAGSRGEVLDVPARAKALDLGTGQVAVWTALPGALGHISVESSDSSVVLAHSPDPSSLPGIAGVRDGVAQVRVWDDSASGRRLLADVRVSVSGQIAEQPNADADAASGPAKASGAPSAS